MYTVLTTLVQEKKKSKNIQTIVVTKNTPDFFSDIDFILFKGAILKTSNNFYY